MHLWQMDVLGGVELEDGTEAKVVTGVDDHTRYLRGRRPHHQGHLQGGLPGPCGACSLRDPR